METSIRISGKIAESIVDGPGIRYVVFTQGCPHHCDGCHNPETHDINGGQDIEIEALLSEIRRNPLISGVTLSGGEPFIQAEKLVPFAKEVKEMGKNIFAYSGYTLEQLAKIPECVKLLELCDYLVDGKFEIENKSLMLKFRGSTNQRIIDLKEYFKTGEIIIANI